MLTAPLQGLQRRLLLPCAGEQAGDFRPFKYDDGENSPELNRDLRIGRSVTREPECMAHEDQMPG